MAKHFRLPTVFSFHDTMLSFPLHTVCFSSLFCVLEFHANCIVDVENLPLSCSHYLSYRIELHACKDWSQQAPVWALVAFWGWCEPCPWGLLGPRECVSLQRGIGQWLARRVSNSYSLQCSWGWSCGLGSMNISTSGLRDARPLWCQEGLGAALTCSPKRSLNVWTTDKAALLSLAWWESLLCWVR